MRLRSEYIISIAIFGILLVIISASVFFTNQQVAQTNNQEQMARTIQTGASDLSYLSNDYFLYQQSAELTLWQSKFSSLSEEISKINPTNPEQQTFIDNVKADSQLLSVVFNGAVSFLESAPRNESVRVLPEFQTAWSRLAVQNRALAFDASILSKSFGDQADQLKQTNNVLILSLIGAFGGYFVMVYFIIYRHTLRSLTKLQEGTKIIGSGNLDYTIVSKGNDEVGELSQAFNQMAANLKTVTASKTDLEQEIAGRKQAEIALRESEQRWATTLASIGDAVIATDVSGRVMFMNGVAEKLTGWNLSEASLKPVKEIFNIVNEQTRVAAEDPVSKVLEKGVIVGLANHTVLIRKNRTEVAIDDSGAPIEDKEGKITGIVLVFRDITQRKEAEEKLEEYRENLEKLVEERTKQLKDAERLAAIGATAGMVGHDIRNPLQAIASDVYLVKTDLSTLPESEEKKSVLESLEGIEENVSYINKIVSDLQDFAKPLTPKLEEIDLEKTVHLVLANLNIPGNVTVKHLIRKDFPKLKTDQSYIQRILTNLANNAIQAMPKGGKLTISASSKNGKATITVQDTGEGIPEEVRGKIFTPLVTTKSKGQGFGLAVVKRFTEGLGGTVTFESEVSKGSKFTIELPT